MKKGAFLKALKDTADGIDNSLREASFTWHGVNFKVYAKPMNTKRFVAIQKELNPKVNDVGQQAMVIAKYCFLDEQGLRLFRTDREVMDAFGELPPDILLSLVADLDLGHEASEEEAEKNS